MIGLMVAALMVSCGADEVEDTVQDKKQEPLIVETDEPGIQPKGDITISNTLPKEGLPDGSFKKNYPNGNVQVEGFVVNGKRSGLWVYYHPNGNKQSENNYINGELDGKTVVYYPSGQIMYIGYYTNGSSDGQWLYFDKEGTLTQEVVYQNGEVVSVVEKNEKPS